MTSREFRDHAAKDVHKFDGSPGSLEAVAIQSSKQSELRAVEEHATQVPPKERSFCNADNLKRPGDWRWR